jgi:hypothetical protein
VKYTDNGGDVWEDVGDGEVRVVVMGGTDVTDSESAPREHVEEKWGPLTPLVDVIDAAELPSDGLPTVADVMDRATVFQSAHALVSGLKWGEEAPSVYDVLNVAKWLEGEA